MSDEEEKPQEDGVEKKSAEQQRCIKYILFSGLLAFIMLLVLVLQTTLLVFAHNGIADRQAASPMDAIDKAAEGIQKNIDTIKQEHQQNQDFLKQFEILPITEKYPAFYQALIDSEQQQGLYIKQYQNLMYDLASRVRGSGEWHSFFTQQLDYYQQRCKNRIRYLKKLAITDSENQT